MISTVDATMNLVNFGLLKSYFKATFKDVGKGADQRLHVKYLYESLFNDMNDLMKCPGRIEKPSRQGVHS